MPKAPKQPPKTQRPTRKPNRQKDTFKSLLDEVDTSKLGKGANVKIKKTPKKKK